MDKLEKNTMAKEVFENHDLLRLIYSFGSVEHRIQMYWVTDSITFPRYKRGDNRVGKVLLSPLPNLMKYHRDWKMYVDFFVYKRCMCCSRHSHRKPNMYLEEGRIVFKHGDKSMVPEAMDKKECECNCRHACRRIINILTDMD